MKTRAIILSLFFATQAMGQGADNLLATGRAYLVQRDLTNASASFRMAVALSPTNETAHAFYGVTRLLSWPNQPAASAFLDRLGISRTNRNIYDWKAKAPRDTNGVLMAPLGMNANEATALLRTNLLPEITAAAANLAKVTSTNFQLSLSEAETSMADVVLDYGDILLVRSALHLLEYLAYTITSWNVDAQLTTIRSLYTNEFTTTQEFLAAYPTLFTFATTNDLVAAKVALTNAVHHYLRASAFIRARPLHTTRMFNYDPELASQERGFREFITDLVDSLDKVVTLRTYPDYAVHLARHFEGSSSLRSFLPQFASDAVLAGTIPDHTFGGLVSGLTGGDVEHLLDKHLRLVPSFSSIRMSLDGSFQLQLNTLRGMNYAIQSSTNLNDWNDVYTGLGSESGLTWISLSSERPSRLFFRAQEAAKPANDHFASRIVLQGSQLALWGSNMGATREVGEPKHFEFSTLENTVWWSWMAPADGFVRLDAKGSEVSPEFAVYTGTTFLAPVSLDRSTTTFKASAGTTYHIVAGTFGSRSGVFKINLAHFPPPPNDRFGARINVTGDAPVLSGYNIGATFEFGEPSHGQSATNSVWWSWTPPVSGRYVISSKESDFDYPTVVLYTGTSLSGLTLVTPQEDPTGVADLTAGTPYQVAVAGSFQRSGRLEITITPAISPSNDNFAARTTIHGSSIIVTASNQAAGQEIGEPSHVAEWWRGGSSVWWQWTAPFSGVATVSTRGTDFETGLAVYTGSALPSLKKLTSESDEDGASRVRFNALARTTYQIAVDGYEGETGEITLHVELKPPPSNDNFANRSAIGGSSGKLTAHNLGATLEPREPKHSSSLSAEGSVWWTWTAPSNGVATLAAKALDTELFLALYSGSTLSNLISIRTADDWESAKVNFKATAGASYDIAFGTFGDQADPLELRWSMSAPATNDHFASRTPMIANSAPVYALTVGATKETEEPNHAGRAGGASLWWTWTAPSNGMALVSVQARDFSPLLAVYEGASLLGLKSLAANSTDSRSAVVTFSTRAGTSYSIAVDDAAGQGGEASVVLEHFAPVANDNLAGAQLLTGTNALVTANNRYATPETGEPEHAGEMGGKSLWWRWTAPSSRQVVITTTGSSFDTLLAVYTGASVSTLTRVASNDEESNFLSTSRVAFTPLAGVTYYIAVDGFEAETGNIVVRLSQ